MELKERSPLVGLAIGDALGMPFELLTWGHPAFDGWDGKFRDATVGLNRGMKSGQWTDDTKMAMSLARGLALAGRFEANTVARQYLDWYESGDLRGIGVTTEQAMRNLLNGKTASGVTGSEGNGTAMRVAPLGLFHAGSLATAARDARLDAVITHSSVEAQEGSVAIAVAVAHLAAGHPKNQLLQAVTNHMASSKTKEKILWMGNEINNGRIGLAQVVVEIGTGGHVVETVPAALACFLLTGDFTTAVTMAVRGGGDADTTAAIAGALAGTYYGYDAIPLHYRAGLESLETLRAAELSLIR